MLAFAALASPAAAQSGNPFKPWDGHNPFNCELQRVGTGVDFPDPDADPFCVEFDKTQQNVTDLGLIDFTSKEPARVAAAGPKCFYFQHDHWTGSVVQGSEPEAYHWDGSYYYDKATGSGGVFVANFRIGGSPADASDYVPAEYKPYFGQGGGGFVGSGEVEADPSCAAKVATASQRRAIYYHRVAAGRIGRRAVGPIRLRMLRKRVIRRLGPPHHRAAHTDRFDVEGGGQLRIAYRGPASNRRVALLMTTSPASKRAGVGPGDKVAAARAALRARPIHRLGRWALLRGGGRGLLVLGARRGVVRWVAIADPRRIRSDGALRRTLARLLAV